MKSFKFIQEQIVQIFQLNDKIQKSCLNLQKIDFSQDKDLELYLKQILNIQSAFENQLKFISQMIDNDSENKDLIQQYEFLQKFQIQLKNKSEINIKVLEMILDFVINNCLQKIELELVQTEKKQKNQKQLELQQKQLIKISYIQSKKLSQIMEFLSSRLQFDENDLMMQEKDTEQWQNIQDNLKLIRVDDEIQIKQKTDKAFIPLIALIAALQETKQVPQNERFSKIKMKVMHFLFNKKESRIACDLFIADPEQIMIKQIFNGMEHIEMKRLSKIILQSIQYERKIYVNSNSFQTLTIDYLQDLQNKEFQQYVPSIVEYDKSLFIQDNDKIQIRVLCSQNMDNDLEKKQFCLFKKPKTFESIIIHIHGGGFVAMSSSSHQIYTRVYANQTNVPIFSIDYKMAPENPFPEGLNDCWQAYLHILQICQKVYKFVPKKVILTGDSAGGNLIAALTYLTIMTKNRIPDGLLMSYPALYCSDQRFTPSLFLCLDDFLLPYTYLKALQDMYIGQNIERLKNSIFVHPLLAQDSILKFFPESKIIIGQKDCLIDDCYRFTQKLTKLNKNIKMTVFAGFIHGFLQMNFPNGIPQSKALINYAINELNLFLKD